MRILLCLYQVIGLSPMFALLTLYPAAAGLVTVAGLNAIATGTQYHLTAFFSF